MPLFFGAERRSGSSMRDSRKLLLVLCSAVGALAGWHCGSAATGVGELLPATLDLGAVAVGASAQGQFTLRNTGNAPLTLEALTVAGPNATDFALAAPLDGPVLSPQETATGTLVFRPSAAGNRQASLQVATNARASADLTMALTGAGVEIRICPQPASLDFGSVQVCDPPVTQEVSLSNCGAEPTTVTIGAVEGPGSADYALMGPSQATLQPGQTLMLTVAFAPGSMGAFTASIPWTACTGCGASPPLVLTGVGTDGVLTLSPNPVIFHQPGTTTVTVTNSGTAALTVDSLSIVNGLPFSIVSLPAFPLVLGPSQAASLTVSFAGGPASDQLRAAWSVACPVVPARATADLLQVQ
jgi:hypothetical protein